MPAPIQFIETLTVASGVAGAFASLPPGVGYALVRPDTGTWRWSETSGSQLTATTGLWMTAADVPAQVFNPAKFRAMPVGGGGTLQGAFYL